MDKARRKEESYLAKRVKEGTRKASHANNAFQARIVAEAVAQKLHIEARHQGFQLGRNQKVGGLTADYTIKPVSGNSHLVDLKVIWRFPTLRNAIGQIAMLGKDWKDPVLFVLVFVGKWQIEEVLGRIEKSFGLRNIVMDRHAPFARMDFHNPAIQVILISVENFDDLIRGWVDGLTKRILEETLKGERQGLHRPTSTVSS